MIVVWLATHSWLVELPYWLESGNSSASSLPSSSTCVFLLLCSFFRLCVLMARKKNATFFMPAKWTKQAIIHWICINLFQPNNDRKARNFKQHTHKQTLQSFITGISSSTHAIPRIFKTFFLNLASTLCTDNTTFSQNYRAQVAQRSAFYHPAV